METAPKVGRIGQTVADNIARARRNQHMSVRDLSARLAELGRPMLPSAITKIEQKTRRVDVDDLMALSVALETTPNTLLSIPSGPDHDVEELFTEHLERVAELFSAVVNAREAGLTAADVTSLAQTQAYAWNVNQKLSIDLAKEATHVVETEKELDRLVSREAKPSGPPIDLVQAVGDADDSDKNLNTEEGSRRGKRQ